MTDGDLAACRAMLAAGDIPVAAIAKRLGIGRRTFYEYFPQARARSQARRPESMPIKPENRWLYPLDWPQLSDVIRFKRARGRCESCGRPHGQLICHLGNGRWWDESGQTWRNGKGRTLKLPPPAALPASIKILTTQVVLACAHLDHDPQNNAPANLKALCQRCHIIHDKAEHLRQRWFTYQLRKALGDLFLGPYPFRY